MKKITILFLLFLTSIDIKINTKDVPQYNLDLCKNINIKVIEKPNNYNKLLEKLAKSESEHNWKIINSIGCFGKYQFKESTLKYLGYDISLEQFKENPYCFNEEMQNQAASKLIETNRIILNSIITQYSGSKINNILITETGILAAAHLAGPTGVKNYFNNKNIAKDKYGTTIENYLRKFAIV